MIGAQTRLATLMARSIVFSTVNNHVSGAGSKIYHNVVGRIGIMSGPWNDLRLGLSQHTMMNGDMP